MEQGGRTKSECGNQLIGSKANDRRRQQLTTENTPWITNANSLDRRTAERENALLNARRKLLSDWFGSHNNHKRDDIGPSGSDFGDAVDCRQSDTAEHKISRRTADLLQLRQALLRNPLGAPLFCLSDGGRTSRHAGKADANVVMGTSRETFR